MHIDLDEYPGIWYLVRIKRLYDMVDKTPSYGYSSTANR